MNILSLQPDFIVIDKEYGISSHASPGDTALNAVDILFQDTERRVAPITRLDRQTSGVMVFSDNPEFIQNVKFMEKTYYALCLGVTPPEGKIEQALTTEGKSQEALTLYKTIKNYNLFSEIHATIMTGRHHQIRRHMRTLGTPVIGDYRHGYNDKNNELQEKLGFRLRCCLHAQTLVFMWKSKKYSFYSEIPADIAAIRDRLKALQ